MARLTTPEPLHIGGTARRPVVEGSLHLDQASVALDKATLMEAGLWTGPSRVIDPAIRLVRDGQVVERSTAVELPFWAPITADLHVDLGQSLEGGLELPYLDGFGALAAEASTIRAEGELVGAVDLAVADGEARVEGRVDVVRGTADVVRSHFQMSGGTVTFVDQNPFSPYVIARGTMPLGGGVGVDMAIRGTPMGADVEFTSSQLDSPNQVLAAVITSTNPADSDGNVGIATALASAVVRKFLFGDLDLGSVQYRKGSLLLDVSVGSHLRVVPEIGLGGNTPDVFAVSTEWFPNSRLVVEARLGTASQRAGITWRRRF